MWYLFILFVLWQGPNAIRTWTFFNFIIARLYIIMIVCVPLFKCLNKIYAHIIICICSFTKCRHQKLYDDDDEHPGPARNYLLGTVYAFISDVGSISTIIHSEILFRTKKYFILFVFWKYLFLCKLTVVFDILCVFEEFFV